MSFFRSYSISGSFLNVHQNFIPEPFLIFPLPNASLRIPHFSDFVVNDRDVRIIIPERRARVILPITPIVISA